MARLEAGVDEAGRGPVIGPLVIACVVADEEGIAALRALVRDSKRMSRAAREGVCRIARSVAREVCIRAIPPSEIDWAVATLERGLNELEAMAVAELVNSLSNSVEVVYVDSPDPLPSRYAALIERYLRRGVKVVSSNHAEDLYPLVAAASIVAKVERDSIVEGLKAEYGDFGSGYPSDPRTRAFLRRICERKGELPPIVRRSWATLEKLGCQPQQPID